MPSPRPYLAFELDALKAANGAATALGVHPGIVAWGLLQLWEACWRKKTDLATELDLACCFGPDQRIPPVLAAADFLAKEGDGWRVRGAGRYLRVAASRVEGGKKRAASAKRDALGQMLGPELAADPADTSSTPAPVQLATSKTPALSASSDDRAASSEQQPVNKNSAANIAAAELLEDLKADFADARQEPLLSEFLRDRAILKKLQKVATNEEIRARWRVSVAEPDPWRQCSSVPDLARTWNRITAPQKRPYDPNQGIIR